MTADDHLIENAPELIQHRPAVKLPLDPRDSIPLLTEIRGDQVYRERLSAASSDLLRDLRRDARLKAATGKSLDVPGKKKPVVPDMAKARSEPHVRAAEVLLHSLAFIASTPARTDEKGKVLRQSYVAITLDKAQFAKGKALEEISHTAFRNLVIWLAYRGWLEFVPMWVGDADNDIRLRTRIRPLGIFKDWMLSCGLIFHGHPTGLGRAKAIPDDQLLRLRHGNQVTVIHRPLDFDEAVLPALNKLLRRQRLQVTFPDYRAYESSFDFTTGRRRYQTGGSKDLYRVFSEEDGRAGRLYGHWVQQIPAYLRGTLKIDGSSTVELDYSGMQMSLLYAHAGKAIPDDADLYDVPGFDRSDMKMVLIRSVGSSGRAEAINAIRYALRQQGRYRRKAEGEPMDMAERMYDAFWTRHEGLSPEALGMDEAWAELQAKDSRLALRVLSVLLDQGVAAIPIHDSFIVKSAKADLLKGVMSDAFQDLFGVGGVQINRGATG
ncbi:hypothetical protein [Phaeobacter sp. A36a-5a]|uniref:hypothetical protein n=1 Tax=Phaeobacter bryozoorum TaxID=1086632 RepID=UPI0035A6A9EE